MTTHAKRTGSASALKAALVCGCLGLAGTMTGGGDAAAQSAPPSEHKGLSVKTLGTMPEASVKATVGLEGHILLLREITIAPGGQIAKHSHAGKPGLVWTLSGSWTEGRPDGDRNYPAGEMTAILEDADTEHWFFNNETEPVKVVVCDMVPAS